MNYSLERAIVNHVRQQAQAELGKTMPLMVASMQPKGKCKIIMTGYGGKTNAAEQITAARMPQKGTTLRGKMHVEGYGKMH